MCRFWKYLYPCLLALMLASFNGTTGHAQDIVKVMLKQSAIDQRGDYKFDLMAGRSARVATVYVDGSGAFPWRGHADLCIKSLSELGSNSRPE